jgi:hypothetical protein
MSDQLPDDPVEAPAGSHAYRRINPEWWVPDGNGGHRLSTQAFQDNPNYLSVGLGSVLATCGEPPERVLEGYEGYGLADLDVSTIRGLALGVTSIPTEAEPWHGGIWGKKTGSIKNKLQAMATVLVQPT